MNPLLSSITLLLWGALCAYQDMQRKKISNTLTLGFFIFSLLYILVTETTFLSFNTSQAIAALAIAALLTLPGYVLGKLGAADVKMLCAIALATHSNYLIICFIGAAISIALWSAAKPIYPKFPRAFTHAFPLMDPTRKQALPYAPFVFIGMLLATALTNV